MNPLKELWNALALYHEVKAEHDKAKAEYDGYSWDYHGRYEIEKLTEARDAAMQAMNAYVDSRIVEYMKSVKSPERTAPDA